MSSPETFGYEPDENGDICFRNVYCDFIILNFDEYMKFVHLFMTDIAKVDVMPIYRAGEPPDGE